MRSSRYSAAGSWVSLGSQYPHNSQQVSDQFTNNLQAYPGDLGKASIALIVLEVISRIESSRVPSTSCNCLESFTSAGSGGVDNACTASTTFLNASMISPLTALCSLIDPS